MKVCYTCGWSAVYETRPDPNYLPEDAEKATYALGDCDSCGKHGLVTFASSFGQDAHDLLKRERYYPDDDC